MAKLENPELGSGKGKKDNNNGKDSKDLIFDVKVSEVEQFPNFIECGLISIRKLTEIISDAMDALLPDFCGAYIMPYPNGQGFDVRLYFTDKGSDVEEDGKLVKARVFTTTNENENNSGSAVLDKLNIITNMPKRKLYYLTAAGKEFMSRFMVGGDPKNVNKVDWNRCTTEIEERRGYDNNVYAVVYGLDLYRLLSFIFGAKDERGEWYTYMINVARQVDALNFLLLVNRVSNTKVNELSRELGYVSGDSIKMVRPTRGI